MRGEASVNGSIKSARSRARSASSNSSYDRTRARARAARDEKEDVSSARRKGIVGRKSPRAENRGEFATLRATRVGLNSNGE